MPPVDTLNVPVPTEKLCEPAFTVLPPWIVTPRNVVVPVPDKDWVAPLNVVTGVVFWVKVPLFVKLPAINKLPAAECVIPAPLLICRLLKFLAFPPAIEPAAPVKITVDVPATIVPADIVSVLAIVVVAEPKL